MELKQKIFNVIKSSRLGCLATTTSDHKPWVRYVAMTVDKDLTIRFSTFITSRKVAQIKKNPEVHLTCGVTDPEKWKEYLQIQGRAVITQDNDEREKFWNKNIARLFSGPKDLNYALVIVKPYRIEYCDTSKFEPEVWEQN